MRKIYIVPNAVTTANMFCGFYSTLASIQGDFTAAAWAIVAAAIFDMLDGRIARLARATSKFGVEYDSLSDLISFGMAPAVFLYQWALEPLGRVGWVASFLFLACGALRLARFNVTSDVVPKGYFQGLPIPMGAVIPVTFYIFAKSMGWDVANKYFILAMTVALACLMVSTIRFPSFKEFNWRSKATFGYLMAAVGAMMLLVIQPEMALFAILGGYIVVSLLWNIYRLARPASER